MTFTYSQYAALVLLLLAGLLASVSGHAAGEATTNSLTLAGALQLAGERNLALRSAMEEKAVARGRIQQSRSAALPHVDVGAQYTRLDDVAMFGDIAMGQKNTYELTADVSQVLYAGGGVRAALRLATEYAAVADAWIADVGEQVAYTVHVRFNQALLARETLAVAAQCEALAKRNHSDVTARLDQGMATRFDQLRADEQLSRAEAQRIAATNGELKARLALLKTLELPLDDAREIVGLLDAALSVNDSVDVDMALQRRPDIVASGRAVAVQREALTVARSGRRPTLALFGQVKQTNPDRSFADEWENQWLVGVRAELPVFDGRETRGKITQAEAALRRARLEHDAAISQARLEIAEARADAATAEKMVEARERNVAQAEEALRLARKSYAEGMQQQIDVITAQTAFTESRYQLASAQFEHTMACRRLELVTGSLTESDNTAK
ncbi:MAG: TolC family protein [Verrucomicrobia bacterium]|jgi:outer membrane protein|nr:TolC family protein [Verrucomicrobiota bacterium]MBT7064749.1 TolC family protein [Verrucomicrobiota bacterium]MBT7699171.1 TolC family protein [Verrucomicrobiota bacterium]